MSPNEYCFLDKLKVTGVKIDDLGAGNSRLFHLSVHSSWHARETGSSVCAVFTYLLLRIVFEGYLDVFYIRETLSVIRFHVVAPDPGISACTRRSGRTSSTAVPRSLVAC